MPCIFGVGKFMLISIMCSNVILYTNFRLLFSIIYFSFKLVVHRLHTCRFLNFSFTAWMIPWSMGWVKDVVLGGRNLTSTLLKSICGWDGALSMNKSIFLFFDFIFLLTVFKKSSKIELVI